MTRSLRTLLALLCPLGALAFDGSSGSPFRVSPCTQLDSIRGTTDFETKDLFLIANVNCSEFGPFASIVGAYEGTFDGDGFAILDLTLSETATQGLFHTLGSGSVIRDLAIRDARMNAVSGSSKVGGLIGDATTITLTRGYASGAISGPADASGVVAQNNFGSIFTSVFSAPSGLPSSGFGGSPTMPAGDAVDGVTLGSGNVVHNDVTLAPRVTLGDDNTLFARVLLATFK